MAHRNDVILSNRVRVGSSSTPRFSTQQVFTASGYRKANQLWQEPLRRLALQFRRPIVDAAEIRKVWMALAGPFDTFLARDWADWNTGDDMRVKGLSAISMTDAPLFNPNISPEDNLGDGSTTVFHTYKGYTAGTTTREFRIRHPESDGFLVAINGVDASGTLSSVNEATGEVTFSAAPGNGLPVTWGGAFYRAVHFVSDDFEELMRNLKVNAYNFELQEARDV